MAEYRPEAEPKAWADGVPVFSGRLFGDVSIRGSASWLTRHPAPACACPSGSRQMFPAGCRRTCRPPPVHAEDLEGRVLVRYPTIEEEQIRWQNGQAPDSAQGRMESGCGRSMPK